MDYTKYFAKVRGKESGGKADAVNPKGGASGLYQFVKSTWEGLGYDWKDRFDVDLQQEAAQRYTEQTHKHLKTFVKGDVTDADLYGAHFLGSGGYKKLYTADPNTPITEIMSPKEISYNLGVVRNPDGSYKTAQGIKDWLAKQMGEGSPQTGGEYNMEPSNEIVIKTWRDPEIKTTILPPKSGEIKTAKIVEDREVTSERSTIIEHTERERAEEVRNITQPQQIQPQQPNYLQDTNLFKYYG